MSGMRNVGKARGSGRKRAGWLVRPAALLGLLVSVLVLGVMQALPAAAVPPTIPVGIAPFDVAFAPDGSFAYVTNLGTSNVSRIRTSDQTVTATVPVGVGPAGVAIAPDGTYAYVVNAAANSVSKLRTSDDTVVATIPVGQAPLFVAFSPDGTFAYVPNSDADTVSRIRTSDDTVTATISVGGGPAGVAISPDGLFAYVTSQIDNSVSRIRTSDDTVTSTTNVGHAPVNVAFAADGTFAYVTNLEDDTVSRIRTSDDNVTATIATGQTPLDVAFAPDGTTAYVTNVFDGTVVRIRTTDNAITATYTTGAWNYSVAFAPDGSLAYVTDYSADTVSVLKTPPALVPLAAPVRVADTRAGEGAGVPVPVVKAPLTPGVPLEVPVGGVYGVPLTGAVSMNVTVAGPVAAGYLTAYPCGAPVPNASNLNFTQGQTVPNGVITGLGTDGKVCVVSDVATDVFVDVNGYLPTGDGYTAMAPVRIFDSRAVHGAAISQPVVKTPLPARTPVEVQVGGTHGVPLTGAVALNVTVDQPADPGFLTVYPCGTPVPNASNLNYLKGQTVPNAVSTGLGNDGKVCLYSQFATNVIVDLQGWFSAPGPLNAVPPVRIADTRAGAGANVPYPTSKVPLSPRTPFEVPVAGLNGVPADAGAVSLNVTVANPVDPGFLTVYPCGQPVPLASNLNYAAGQTVPNAVQSGVGTGGKVCLYSQFATDVFIDLNGWYPTPAPVP